MNAFVYDIKYAIDNAVVNSEHIPIRFLLMIFACYFRVRVVFDFRSLVSTIENQKLKNHILKGGRCVLKL